ncbi:S1 family peptidase [Paenibacillus sp. S150]|uniref:S1 family peptidase n=1 Tax=Paenibacillus sp. S150 TaxID=2749826 RepID=UPI001C5881EA|nr:S1 family peptidase [Paenibacillus sp. S150]MBW4081964.1 trypsin-like serine protease [Paenibacillus sp. S150]
MKKNIRYFLCLMLVFLMIPLSVAASSPDRNADLTHTVPKAIIQAMELQEPALRAYQNLWDSFNKDELGTPIYPDDYAGEYISGDKLVIMLVEPSQELQAEYIKRAQDNEHVKFESASYSLNYLNSLDQVAQQLQEQDYRIGSYGVDRKANLFYISVIQEDYNKLMDEQFQTLQKTTENLPIRIEPGTPNTSTAQLWGGDRITNEDNGAGLSVGIGGTYGGSNAILTAGHSNEKVGLLFTRYPYIQYSGTRTGQVSYQRANRSSGATGVDSLGDFAMVTLSGSDTPTNKVYGSVSITGTYSSVPVGTTIYKYGATTGYSWGTVTQASISVTYSDGLFTTYYVNGLYQSVMQNSSGTDAIAGGDSGGPVYMKDGTANKLHGIVTARSNPTSGPATIMYSTPIYYAENAGFTVKVN